MVSRRVYVLLLRPADEPLGRRPDERLVIAHIPVMDWEPITENVKRVEGLLGEVDWVVFTSPRGVKAVAPLAKQLREAVSKGLKIAVVGPRTREVLKNILGLDPHLMPGKYLGVEVGKALVSCGAKRVLLLRSPEATRDIIDVLKSSGIEAIDLPVYKMVVLDEMVEAAVNIANTFDYVVFTSPSIARAFFSKWKGVVRFRIASIGPTTSREIRRLGFEPHVEASEHTLEGVFKAIVSDAYKT